jgi:hypothetical protein
VVCLDGTSKQLVAETRVPVPMKPGQPARSEYEHERNGTANMFMMFAPLEGWRHVKVTDRHTAVDYAHTVKDLSDSHYGCPENHSRAGQSQHPKPASLYEAFSAAEARRLVERFEWHYTPKHGSWLDMAESELGVLSSQSICSRGPALPSTVRLVAGRGSSSSSISRCTVCTWSSGLSWSVGLLFVRGGRSFLPVITRRNVGRGP